MNAPLPQNVTSQQTASALPDAWIVRLFSRMASMYGSKFADLWAGANEEEVRKVWAEKLAGFADKPGCIKSAVDALDDRPYPPTLPEFLALCRQAARRIGDDMKALPYRPTADDEARIKAAASDAVKALKPKVGDGIDKHWATHPRSAMHLKFIFDAAGKDQRFKPCIDEMVEKGICSADGHLLKTYRDGAWVRP